MVANDVAGQCGGSLTSEVTVSLSAPRRVGVINRVCSRLSNIGSSLRASRASSLSCAGNVQTTVACSGGQQVEQVQPVAEPVDCPTCVQSVSTSTTITSQVTVASTLQAEAESEAAQMAASRRKGHIRGVIRGVAFCGVGWSSSSPNAPTCTPGRGMTLVADATVRGADGFYRVRYWQ